MSSKLIAKILKFTNEISQDLSLLEKLDSFFEQEKKELENETEENLYDLYSACLGLIENEQKKYLKVIFHCINKSFKINEKAVIILNDKDLQFLGGHCEKNEVNKYITKMVIDYLLLRYSFENYEMINIEASTTELGITGFYLKGFIAKVSLTNMQKKF